MRRQFLASLVLQEDLTCSAKHWLFKAESALYFKGSMAITPEALATCRGVRGTQLSYTHIALRRSGHPILYAQVKTLTTLREN